MKSLKDEYKALLKNGKAQDRINEKLKDARAALKDLRKQSKDYARSVKDSAIGYASITGLDSAFNPAAIAAAMRARLEKLRQFVAVITQLKTAGLNQTTLDQLIQCGVEGGLAYALALQQGGQAAVDEINGLQTQIGDVAGQLGQTAASSMYDAGVAAAEGIVKGLESQAARLEKAAAKLARALVKAIKKALGINSPSKVFMGIGDNIVQGLTIGLDETYVKRSAASLAASLQKGFGTPALEAYASQNATSGPGGNTYQITVKADATTDQVALGRNLTKAISAYEAAGGRRR
jgi:hypothetical protein